MPGLKTPYFFEPLEAIRVFGSIAPGWRGWNFTTLRYSFYLPELQSLHFNSCLGKYLSGSVTSTEGTNKEKKIIKKYKLPVTK